MTGFPAWHHFGFRADSAVEVEELRERARAAGAPILMDLVREDDFAAFRLADPDGYQIEVYWDA